MQAPQIAFSVSSLGDGNVFLERSAKSEASATWGTHFITPACFPLPWGSEKSTGDRQGKLTASDLSTFVASGSKYAAVPEICHGTIVCFCPVTGV